ncbi:N-acetyltransferase [Clostridia bacterium]|nr:N-acetyltransferase [Clostridia bacterium]
MIETKRLLLRPFATEDFAAVHDYAGNAQNVKFMHWGPNTEQDTRDFIAGSIKSALATPRKDYTLAVTLKEDNRLIGGADIALTWDLKQAEMGWILHRDCWKNGYGAELGAGLLRFGFQTLKLHRMYARCDADNYGSYRVMERNDMRLEAKFILSRFNTSKNEWGDEYHYAILDHEWRRAVIEN